VNLPSPEKIFFISDTHFGHAGIINLCGRPFRSVEEMDDQLIEMWNETIPEGALVFHLGDVSFRGKSATYGILGQLKGRIVLIRGNHDRQINSNTDSRFEEIHDYFELNLESRKIVLCHFPFESWNNMHHGSWHLHGHSHGNMRAFGKRLDVGVDSLRYYSPVSYYVIRDILDNRPVEARDHHYERAVHTVRPQEMDLPKGEEGSRPAGLLRLPAMQDTAD